MKAFREWQKNREVKTIGYLTNAGAYKAGEEAGWRAALEWILAEWMWEWNPKAEEIKESIEEELADDSPISP